MIFAFGRARPPVLLLSAVFVPATWTPGQIPLTPVALYDRHVIFQDSLSLAACHETAGAFVAPSRLDLLDGKLPLAHDRSVSPPSSLRLSWRSAAGGDWRARISVPSRYGRRFDFDGDSLSLWCRAEQEIGETAAPRISLEDTRGNRTPSIALIRGADLLPAGQWTRLILRFADFVQPFRATEDPAFDPRSLAHVHLVQGLDDGLDHTVLLDDLFIVDSTSRDAEPPPRPGKLVVRPGERHFDLSWEPGAASDLLCYRVYRSLDSGTRELVAVRRGDQPRHVDFVAGPGITARYRVTAVDLHGNESEPGEEVVGVTRTLDDAGLLDLVQQGCFRYYWEGAHPACGMALEILPGDPNLVAVGASGFGVLALLVAAERGFVSREAAVDRLLAIVRFLGSADRFHGAFPHFLDGRTGRVVPYFGKYDDGGDLVETAYLIAGLLAARQYFSRENAREGEIRERITRLWREVEWDWYRQDPASEVLYWHWSPQHGFHINHPLIGWNETMIVYLLAIASPTHPVPASLYHTGWAGQSARAVQYRRNWSRTTDGDRYTNGNSYYGIRLDVGEGNGAELFFTQFGFLGFDPRGLRDRYTNYFRNNRAIARIQQAYAIENPLRRKGYGPDCWGRSAGINAAGGRALPRDDNGTITISAALGSFPYTPAESMAVLRRCYRTLGPRVWGPFGFHDGFNETEDWFEEVYMGLNQAPIVVMIENHRSGLVWKHFMASPEIRPMLESIEFMEDQDPGGK